MCGRAPAVYYEGGCIMANNFMEDITATFDSADIEKNKTVAALASIPALFWLPFVAAKDSPFAKFYANVGLVLLIAGVVASILMKILGWFGGLVGGLIQLAVTIAVIISLVNGFQGKAVKLPVIGEIVIIK
jgi:uncharacterized membrane protein